MGNRPPGARSNHSIDRAVVVSLLRQAHLDAAAQRALANINWRCAEVDNQPAPVVIPVPMMVPTVLSMHIPVTVSLGGNPLPVVVIGLIPMDRERGGLAG